MLVPGESTNVYVHMNLGRGGVCVYVSVRKGFASPEHSS